MKTKPKPRMIRKGGVAIMISKGENIITIPARKMKFVECHEDPLHCNTCLYYGHLCGSIPYLARGRTDGKIGYYVDIK